MFPLLKKVKNLSPTLPLDIMLKRFSVIVKPELKYGAAKTVAYLKDSSLDF